MALTLPTPPTSEPLSLDEAKLQARVVVNDEDVLIENLIVVARQWLEAITGRAFIDQVWTLTLDAMPADGVIVLPRPPLRSVISVSYVNAAGVSTTWAAGTGYQVKRPGGPFAERGQIAPAYGTSAPTTRSDTFDAVTVMFLAGYGTSAADVPRPLRQAVALLVAHLYANREAIQNVGPLQELPLGVKALVAPYINRVTC
jgi:uncharacterized phiE125 gp8 family phage protein